MKRFPTTASTPGVARRYYRERALQGLPRGWRLDALTEQVEANGVPWAVEAQLRDPSGERARSLFCLDGGMEPSRLERWLARCSTPVVTHSRPASALLEAHDIPHTRVPEPTDVCYLAVQHLYGDRRALRSGRFLMAHIDEGLFLLATRGAAPEVCQAFCLHPLVQGDEELAASLSTLAGLPAVPVALAMEYRHRANAHLPHHRPATPNPGPLPEIVEMLVADKIQNRKDFEVSLRGHIPNTLRLDAYFQEWFAALGISEDVYAEQVRELSERSLQPIRVTRSHGLARAEKRSA